MNWKTFLSAAFFYGCLCVLFSCSCAIRTYAPFSESNPAIEDSGEVHVGASVNLLRAEIHSSAALLNHWAITTSAGVRAPLTTRWSANAWQTGAGYYIKTNAHNGYELFAGYGQEHFKNLLDTITCTKVSDLYTGRDAQNSVNTNIVYHYFFLNPDVWIRSNVFKFIFGLNLKYLATPHFNYYVKQYVQEADSTVKINFENTYNQKAYAILFEPSVQIRAGKKLNGYVELKSTSVVGTNLKDPIKFNTPQMLISFGVEYYFHLK